MIQQITLRPATINDAPAIAEVIHCAIGDEAASRDYCGENYLEVLSAVARAENTQYSWVNAIVAECDGKIVGGVVGYDGALLKPLRKGTLDIIRQLVGRAPSIPNETDDSEYYLDSVAVHEDFRGRGIGKLLVEAFCNKAFDAGAQRVGLIVDVENPDAQKVYTSVGFRAVGQRMFFGHKMHHLQRMRTCDTQN